MFVYVLIIFLSLFLIEASIKTKIACVTDNDCPRAIKPVVMWCINNYCHYYLYRYQ
uniref:Late nodulin domain-containing protein n=1 Tax=Medicago truncatula TaxID=3880 RepID=I3SCZ6_MEDTR|nr:unknown [Medicago truncatula]